MATDFDKLDSFFQSGESNNRHKKRLNHAERVRLVKLVLPCIAAFLLSLLVIIPHLRQQINEIKIDITKPKTGELEKLHVENTVFYITDKDNRVHNITADHIDETKAGSKLIKITNPEGTMPSDVDTWVNIKSPIGYFNQTKNTLILKGGVESFYSDGIVMETVDLVYNFNKKKAASKKPVKAEGFFGDLQAEGFRYNTQTGVLVFTGKTNINLNEKGIEGNK